MKKLILFTLVCSVAGLVSTASADTVAYWRFEEGPAGAQVPKTTPGVTWEPSTADSSGNGYHLSVWDEGGAGYVYRSEVAYPTVPLTGDTNNFSVKNSGGWPAMWTETGAGIQTITPAAFTIEATFKLENGGYRTIVGRDSQGATTNGDSTDGNLAALYFQAMPDNRLAIKFCDVSGYWHEAISETNAFTSFDYPTDPDGLQAPWYSMAAVSDGSNLLLYLTEIGAGGWNLIAETDMTVVNPSPDTALTAGAGDGGDWDAGNWSVGRGLYAGGHGDRAWGYLDEVRISDAALTTGEFLVPEPATMAILGLGSLVVLRRRRKP